MSKLDVLHSPSVGFSGFSTPPYSQSVFPNYKLEIQDGRGREGGGGWELRPLGLSLSDSPPQTAGTSSLTPYCLHPYPPVGY